LGNRKAGKDGPGIDVRHVGCDGFRCWKTGTARRAPTWSRPRLPKPETIGHILAAVPDADSRRGPRPGFRPRSRDGRGRRTQFTTADCCRCELPWNLHSNPGLRVRFASPLGPFPEGRGFRYRESLAPPGKDLGGLLPSAEIRLLKRSPWIARCRLSSQRRLGRGACPVKKVAPGTSRPRGRS